MENTDIELIKVNVEDTLKTLEELKTKLREIEVAMSGMTEGSEAFIEASVKSEALKAKIDEINESLKATTSTIQTVNNELNKIEPIEVNTQSAIKSLEEVKTKVEEVKESVKVDGDVEVNTQSAVKSLEEVKTKVEEVKTEVKTKGEVKVETKPAMTSLKELRNSLKSVKDEMVSLDEGSDAFLEAANRAGTLKHQLDEINEATKGASADFGDMLGNVSGSLAGITGGFQAAQAALSLFGVESEEVTKSIKTMQSVMALTQGFASIDTGIKALAKLRNSITSTTKVAKLLRSALQPKVILALSAAISALVVLWKRFGDDLKEKFPWIEKITTAFTTLKEKILGVKDSMDEMSKSSAELQKELDKMENDDKIAKMNKSAQDSYKSLDREIEKAEKQLEIYNAKVVEINQNEQYSDNLKQLLIRTQQRHIDETQKLINKKKEEQQAILDSAESYKIEEKAIKSLNASNKQVKEVESKAKSNVSSIYAGTWAGWKNEIQELKLLQKSVKDTNAEFEKLYGYAPSKVKIFEPIEEGEILFENLSEAGKNAYEELIAKQKEFSEKALANNQLYYNLRMKQIENATYKEGVQYSVPEKFDVEYLYNTKNEEDLTNLLGLLYRERENIINKTKTLGDESKLTEQTLEWLNNLIASAIQRMKDLKAEQDEAFRNQSEYLLNIELVKARIAQLDEKYPTTYANNIAELSAELEIEKKRLELMEEGTLEYENQSLLIKQMVFDLKTLKTEAILEGIKTTATGLDYITQTLDGISSAWQTIIQQQLDEGKITQEQAEEQFEQTKALTYASVVFSTLTGVMNAWASWMSPMNAYLTTPVQATMAALQTAALLATGAAQLAQVKSQTLGSSSSLSSTSSNAVSQTIIPPTQYTSQIQSAEINSNIKDTKVYVVENDLRRVGKRVSVEENESRY